MKKLFSNFYQSEYWALFQKNKGWLIYKYKYNDGCIYIYFKKFLFIYVLWSPGLSCESLQHIDIALNKILEEKKIKLYYFRISVLDLIRDDGFKFCKRSKWFSSLINIGSQESFRLAINKDIDTILRECSGNWRHNYKRSMRNDLVYELWDNPDPVLMHGVIRSMEAAKDLTLNYSLKDLREIAECFRGQMLILRALDPKGVTIAFRAAVIGSDNVAWDFLAAANKNARKIYASYGLVIELIKQCQNIGVEYYDFSGVDKKLNLGVYNFKKGVGGDCIKYFGEYEKGNLALRYAINFSIFIKKK